MFVPTFIADATSVVLVRLMVKRAFAGARYVYSNLYRQTVAGIH